MSTILDSNINPYFLLNPNYQLAVKYSKKITYIKMSLFTDFYHTNSLPQTTEILRQNLPSVLATQCFNEYNLPFKHEVKNTEIGHLFEHIILQYLCQEKIARGYKKASFRGVTKWNWKNEARGTFNIQIGLNPADIIYLDLALTKSIELLNKILIRN